MARWKLLVSMCLAAVVGGLVVRGMFQSPAGAAQRGSVQPAQSSVRWIAVRQLAQGKLPGRATYTIRGERYRFQRRAYFTLAISIDRGGPPRGGGGPPPGGGGGGGFSPAQRPGPLAYTVLAACAPHPYAVVFGLLRAPKDIVVASRGSSRTVLRHVAIPAIFRAHGVLVYATDTCAARGHCAAA